MTYSFSYLAPVCCSMCSSNCCFLTYIQISQEAGTWAGLVNNKRIKFGSDFDLDDRIPMEPIIILRMTSNIPFFGFVLSVENFQAKKKNCMVFIDRKTLACVSAESPAMSNSFVTPWMVAPQDPLPMVFSRQEYWSWLPCPPPGVLPDPHIDSISYVSCIVRWVLYH